MMRFTKRCFTAVVAIVLFPAPLQAETSAEIADYLQSIKFDMLSLRHNCAIKGELSQDCGDTAGAVICDYQGIMRVGVESNREAHVAPAVQDLSKIISRNADYIERLITGGHMPDTGKISMAETRRYCREIGASVIP